MQIWLLTVGFGLAFARDNQGVGKLPVMVCNVTHLPADADLLHTHTHHSQGYDTFNAFNGDYDAQNALEQVEAMSRLGLVDLGYVSAPSSTMQMYCTTKQALTTSRKPSSSMTIIRTSHGLKTGQLFPMRRCSKASLRYMTGPTR